MFVILATAIVKFQIFTQDMVLAAAAVTDGTDWISVLLNGGPFAFVLLLLLLDKLTTPGERDRLRLENGQLKEEIKNLNEHIREEIIPPLVKLNVIMTEAIEELTILKREHKSELRKE